jgi:hypothetical protein
MASGGAGLSNGGQAAFEVADEVVGVFDSDRKAQQAGADPVRSEFVGRQQRAWW